VKAPHTMADVHDDGRARREVCRRLRDRFAVLDDANSKLVEAPSGLPPCLARVVALYMCEQVCDLGRCTAQAAAAASHPSLPNVSHARPETHYSISLRTSLNVDAPSEVDVSTWLDIRDGLHRCGEPSGSLLRILTVPYPWWRLPRGSGPGKQDRRPSYSGTRAMWIKTRPSSFLSVEWRDFHLRCMVDSFAGSRRRGGGMLPFPPPWGGTR